MQIIYKGMDRTFSREGPFASRRRCNYRYRVTPSPARAYSRCGPTSREYLIIHALPPDPLNIFNRRSATCSQPCGSSATVCVNSPASDLPARSGQRSANGCLPHFFRQPTSVHAENLGHGPEFLVVRVALAPSPARCKPSTDSFTGAGKLVP